MGVIEQISTQQQQQQQQQQKAGKMARSGVPVTIRNFLNDDPFFKNTWEDFDKLTEECFLNQGTHGRGLIRISETRPAPACRSLLNKPSQEKRGRNLHRRTVA